MQDIRKITFFDVETVGQTADYQSLEATDPRRADLWAKWQDKYKETNGDMTLNEVWIQKAGLHAEYAKVVCVSFGFYDEDMSPRIASFYGDDEKDVLTKVAKVINNSDAKGNILGGHNIERFDIPFLWKKMLSHGIKPPYSLSVLDKKPWDLKLFDTAKVWSGGSWKESFTSLDTLAAVFDVDSPKQDMKATEVHGQYWFSSGLEKIKEYCEQDIRATMEISDKILKILNEK